MSRKLIAVVGPTASGKTSLAIDLAARLPGDFEAINADSRQVYRRMDIGTAKPKPDERAMLTHHLIDIVDPDEPFGLATWLDMANEALVAVWERGGLPVLVGGTGQYVWALLEGWRIASWMDARHKRYWRSCAGSTRNRASLFSRRTRVA